MNKTLFLKDIVCANKNLSLTESASHFFLFLSLSFFLSFLFLRWEITGECNTNKWATVIIVVVGNRERERERERER